MLDSSELKDELQTLKDDFTRLLNTTSEGIFDASKNRSHTLADQVKAALNDLNDSRSLQGHLRVASWSPPAKSTVPLSMR